MKRIILCIGLALTTSSCVSNRIDLIQTNAVTLDEVVPPELNISTSIYEDDGNLVILGELSREVLDKRHIPGHIDIEVSSPVGEQLVSVAVHFRSVQSWGYQKKSWRYQRRHGSKPVVFKAELPGVPPLGSKVQVKYDVNEH